MAYKRILFGTDGSASAQAAGVVAARLAQAGGAQLIVGVAFERATDAEQIVAAAIQHAEAAGVRRVSGEARAGVPADALIALADGHDVGLVVVSGGRGKQYGLGAGGASAWPSVPRATSSWCRARHSGGSTGPSIGGS